VVIRGIVIVFLLLLVIEMEGKLATSVTEKAEREHLAKVVLHTCAHTARSAPALERCHEVGLRAVDRLAPPTNGRGGGSDQPSARSMGCPRRRGLRRPRHRVRQAGVRMTRYYLGIAVRVDPDTEAADGWMWATWPDGRRFLHWAEQLREEPWG
jgi:hypothetical protein